MGSGSWPWDLASSRRLLSGRSGETEVREQPGPELTRGSAGPPLRLGARSTTPLSCLPGLWLLPTQPPTARCPAVVMGSRSLSSARPAKGNAAAAAEHSRNPGRGQDRAPLQPPSPASTHVSPGWSSRRSSSGPSLGSGRSGGSPWPTSKGPGASAPVPQASTVPSPHSKLTLARPRPCHTPGTQGPLSLGGTDAGLELGLGSSVQCPQVAGGSGRNAVSAEQVPREVPHLAPFPPQPSRDVHSLRSTH